MNLIKNLHNRTDKYKQKEAELNSRRNQLRFSLAKHISRKSNRINKIEAVMSIRIDDIIDAKPKYSKLPFHILLLHSKGDNYDEMLELIREECGFFNQLFNRRN